MAANEITNVMVDMTDLIRGHGSQIGRLLATINFLFTTIMPDDSLLIQNLNLAC